jgi:hypothetical protein
MRRINSKKITRIGLIKRLSNDYSLKSMKNLDTYEFTR